MLKNGKKNQGNKEFHGEEAGEGGKEEGGRLVERGRESIGGGEKGLPPAWAHQLKKDIDCFRVLLDHLM